MQDDSYELRIPAQARDVAAALGAGWSAQPGRQGGNRDARLVGPGDVWIHMRGGGYLHPGRLVLGDSLGDLDKYARGAPEYKQFRKITVSPDKTPAQIAADIRRRLLPGLAALFEAARKRKAASGAANARQRAIGDQLVAGMGPAAGLQMEGRYRKDPDPKWTGRIELGKYGDVITGNVLVQHDTDVHFTIEVRAAPDVAARLAARIGELIKEAGQR